MAMPRLVVLDGFPLNAGDLSWAELESLAACEIFDRTRPEEVRGRCAGAELVLTNKVPLDAAAIQALPALRYIGVLATGYNIVDTAAARARGIPVTNVPSYGTAAVAQTAWAFILNFTHRIEHHASAVRAGAWSRCPDFSFWDFPLRELAGKTLGIVGFGEIGQALGRVGRAFGMHVMVHTRSERQPDFGPVRFASLEAVLRESDFVSLHCPLTDATRGLINAERLSWMKPDAFLVNTARGPLIVEQDLAAALNENRLGGAGLDVLADEPPAPDNPLLQAKNCWVTPHFGWASREARRRLITQAAVNVSAFLAGNPQNVVNGGG